MNAQLIDQHQRSVASRGTSRQQAEVWFASNLTALDAPGGGEIQMQATASALKRQGIGVEFWRPWEQSLSEANCLHLFGSHREHLPLVEAARRRSLPVVLSPIAWFDYSNSWHQPKSFLFRAAAATRFLVRIAYPRISSWRKRLYQAVDILLPNSQAEAVQLQYYFGVRSQQIHVVPNGAPSHFATADAEQFVRWQGIRDFVLCTGRIEPRKNQLGLLRALRGTDLPVVILGDVVPGHESYYQRCRREAGANVRFLPRLVHDDPRLAGAYAACACLALPSWFETPGLVALEAAMSGTPLVLPQGGCAREYFGDQAQYVHPTDYRGIREAVFRARSWGRNRELAALVQSHYCWSNVALHTRKAYAKVFRT